MKTVRRRQIPAGEIFPPWMGKAQRDVASGPKLGYIHARMLTNRKQVYLAAGGSLLLHLLVLLAWAFTVRWLPAPKAAAPTPPPIHLEITKAEETPPPMAEETPTPTPRPFLDTSSRAAAEHPAADPKFESNQDTEAASRLPAAGDAPLPSQRGKIAPNFNFDTTHYTPGEAPSVASAASAGEPPPQPTATPAARPAQTPSHTPVPDDEFGLPAPTPTPEDSEPPFDPAFRAPASTMPERPTVASRASNASNAAGFQAEKQLTSVSGNIGKQGDANVDSVATPIGRYRSRVIRAISVKWHDYFNARSDVVSFGMLRIHIVVDRRGKVQVTKVLSNSSNEAMAAVSTQALMDAAIPPMLPETLAALPGGELPMDLTFDAE